MSRDKEGNEFVAQLLAARAVFGQAMQFGQQPDQVIRAAHERRVEQNPPQKQQHLESALTYAQEKNLERHAVTYEYELMRDALKRSMGEASFAEVREGFDKRVQSGDLIEVLATDPGSVPDFAAWATSTGNELVERTEEDGVYRFVLRKR